MCFFFEPLPVQHTHKHAQPRAWHDLRSKAKKHKHSGEAEGSLLREMQHGIILCFQSLKELLSSQFAANSDRLPTGLRIKLCSYSFILFWAGPTAYLFDIIRSNLCALTEEQVIFSLLSIFPLLTFGREFSDKYQTHFLTVCWIFPHRCQHLRHCSYVCRRIAAYGILISAWRGGCGVKMQVPVLQRDLIIKVPKKEKNKKLILSIHTMCK